MLNFFWWPFVGCEDWRQDWQRFLRLPESIFSFMVMWISFSFYGHANMSFPSRSFHIWWKVIKNIRNICSAIFELPCYSQVATICKKIGHCCKLSMVKLLFFIADKQLLVKVVGHRQQETILDDTWRDVQLEHCIVPWVQIHRPPPRLPWTFTLSRSIAPTSQKMFTSVIHVVKTFPVSQFLFLANTKKKLHGGKKRIAS